MYIPVVHVHLSLVIKYCMWLYQVFRKSNSSVTQQHLDTYCYTCNSFLLGGRLNSHASFLLSVLLHNISIKAQKEFCFQLLFFEHQFSLLMMMSLSYFTGSRAFTIPDPGQRAAKQWLKKDRT